MRPIEYENNEELRQKMNTLSSYNIFIIGCGDVGRQVAERWKKRGAALSALARSAESASRLSELGICTVKGDLDRPETVQNLPLSGAWVYYFAPPPDSGFTDPRMEAFITGLEGVTPPPCGIVYIGTSGVYGDCQGAWVDEDATLAPATDRAKRRVDAEQQLRAWGRAHSVPVIILRVGGIYGPGRLPLKRLQQAAPVLHFEESPFSNRIHIDDLVTISLAAVERGRADRVYNVCDDNPSTMTDYFCAVADAVGLPSPPMITMQQAEQVMSAAMLSYLTESRRMVNRRLHDELKVTLAYPDLAAGLKDI
ncbi:MAG: SDR family oxidoreductase [Candidatus Polarisedimenticolaceae bacterium]|nr:SDR family oxidoreductase [Candidatus Polarisedimenticolaceae bacterium]